MEQTDTPPGRRGRAGPVGEGSSGAQPRGRAGFPLRHRVPSQDRGGQGQKQTRLRSPPLALTRDFSSFQKEKATLDEVSKVQVTGFKKARACLGKSCSVLVCPASGETPAPRVQPVSEAT